MIWEIVVRVEAADAHEAYAMLSNRLDGWAEAQAVSPRVEAKEGAERDLTLAEAAAGVSGDYVPPPIFPNPVRRMR